MARPQTDIEAGREQLLDIVTEMIVGRGATGLTMTELAARAGMSPSNLYRFFESKDAVIEAMAERWFRPSVRIMEEVVHSDLPARRKMFEIFARRFAVQRKSYYADPIAFASYCEIGGEHFEQVRSQIDLADHYLAELIGQAMAEGYFAGLEIDEALSLINQMVMPYCNHIVMVKIMDKLSEEKLAKIIDAVFDGLSAEDRGALSVKGLRAA